jgi:arylsulfatase A-like enzyme
MAIEERLRDPCRVLLVCALGSIALNACSPASEPRESESHDTGRPNVLVIAIDTLRADKLGCYGGTRGLTPNIDRIASQGARFEHAFSHAPWTLPAFASLFSSLLPPEHGAGGSLTDDFRALPESVETIAERLDSEGYSTAAIVNVDFLSKTFGLMQGFRHVDDKFSDNNRDMRNAGDTTSAALRWLDSRPKKPFFLFVHYFDPHAEYAPPQPFRRQFAKPQDAETDGFTFGTREQIVAYRRGEIQFRPLDLERAEALYDGEVAYTDAEVGVLLAGLGERGLDASTLVVLTADHGEEFLDHGGYEHGHALYDELIAVPLIVRHTARIAPGTIALPVGLMDVAPTLCTLLGIEPSPRFRGRDLSPLLRGATLEPSTLVAYGNFWGQPLGSLRAGDFKLIHTPPRAGSSDRLELYRWSQDADEKHDLSAVEQQTTRDLKLALDTELARSKRVRPDPAPNAPVSEEELERLRGLGYIQSGQSPTPPK